MSDDAFALTPVAAQPPQPSETVYQALNAALSATARGRWFLSEFAKRNRTSESSKMLDAVARFEQVVADPALAAVSADLLIVRNWAKVARIDVANPPDASARDAAQAAAQRGSRIIREIASSLRAAGSDSRICTILDTQLDAIEMAQRSNDDPAKNALVAFDRLIARIEELIPSPPAEVSAPATAAPSNSFVAVDPDIRLAAVADLAVACATGDPSVAPTPAQIAEDDDLLERIALEMAFADDTLGPEPAEPSAVANQMPVEADEPVSDPDPVAPMKTNGSSGLSLGDSVLAQGLVQPLTSVRDPFVALKRLTQAEKVALFT